VLPFPAAALLSSGFMNDTVLHSQINASAENHTAPTAGVTVHTFENGLQLIVREDHSAPVVSAQAWCRAGSIDEGDWIGAGLSHVLEHMLFKGTTTRGAGRIDQEVQAAGGYMNAYTSFDRTVYWINVPVSGGRVAIDILCDIFQHATLPADELVKELDVIRREMDMCNDDPGRRSSRRLFEVAFIRSPYRYPIIGIPDIFNRLTRDQIAAYYTEKYAPNNCFLVVAGDVHPPDVIAQVEACFAKSQARPVPVSVIPAEPGQTSGREVIEEAPVELGHFHFAWHIGDLRHRDTPVLDVLATLLGNGRSSRLYQSVRERAGLAHSVSSWIYTPGHAGLFGVSGVADGDKFMAARDAILEQVERMKSDLVAPAELAKAVKQFTAGTLSSRKTMEGQAQDLGSNWLAAYDLEFSERYLAAVKRVTPEDIQRVANQYLVETNRTIYALLPTGTAPKRAAFFESSTQNPIQRFQLPNGARLLIKEDHRLPFVEFRAVFQGGVLAESPDKNGITYLMSKLLIKGTSTRNGEAIAETIEGVGGTLESYGGNNSFGLSAEVLSSDFALGLDLVSDCLQNPLWAPETLERERQVQLASLKGQRDQLLHSAFKLLRKGLSGNAGYGLDQLGTESSVSGIQASDLADFHRRLVVPNNAVLAIYGDVNAETAREAVQKAFAHWTPGAGPGTPPHVESIPERRLLETRDKEQAVVVLGFPGATLHTPDRYALELIQEACSDMGSRLFMRIRDELGLAYYVGASNFLGLLPGYFAFYCGTAPEQAAQVEAELRAQAELLRREGLSDEELSRAKAKLLGQRKISRQDLGHLAASTALDELYGLGFDNADKEDALIEAVTSEEIRAAARAYLQADRSLVAIVKGEPGSKDRKSD
jgi:zinc protease